MEKIHKGPQDSLVNRVECVEAILIKSQKKGKGPIQHLGDPEVKDQFELFMGTSNPNPVMGLLSSIQPNSVGLSNELSITEALDPFQVVPLSMPFRKMSYPLKDPLRGLNSKEGLSAIPISSLMRKNILPQGVKLQPMKRKREYIANHDSKDESSVIQGGIIEIDGTILEKVMCLSIGEIVVGADDSSDFSPRRYFKGGMSAFERSQGWQTTEAISPELVEWFRFRTWDLEREKLKCQLQAKGDKVELLTKEKEILKLEAEVRELDEYDEDLSNQLRKEPMDGLEKEENLNLELESVEPTFDNVAND
uniref:Predicted protein n=1 Tax=Physcomitrium patens TaxID=3218 RepID=A9U0A0_PHYPA